MQFLLHFEQIPEEKDLVLDGDLTKSLDRVAGHSFLKVITLLGGNVLER